MKYMGSKRSLLENGLGKIILSECENKKRFIDLFSGTGSVATYVAKNTELEVVAVDLQVYSTLMSDAVLSRTSPYNTQNIYTTWLPEISKKLRNSKLWQQIEELEAQAIKDTQYVFKTRDLCNQKSFIGPVLNAYGGYYFSALQAITFDYMLKNLPEDEEMKKICHAAIISAASQCAAAPGHTAQPFNPEGNGLKYILEAWKKDPIEYFKLGAEKIAKEYALVAGYGLSSDAETYTEFITDEDVVFLDPPYSGVQYSRFYHVLETIARNKQYEVSGAGRYPSITERPQSEFSNVGSSKLALERLLKKLATTGATLIFTFPEKECSNGLSGDFILDTAKEWFEIQTITSNSKFSTMGGNNIHRDARMHYDELVLIMTNKNRKQKSFNKAIYTIANIQNSKTNENAILFS
ncbi:DNA adenine methylase [bacterium]|nr:DNA adenine methylase [bacterium]MBU1883423.1 DNA adenine methylase [bacterium]